MDLDDTSKLDVSAFVDLDINTDISFSYRMEGSIRDVTIYIDDDEYCFTREEIKHILKALKNI